MNESTKSPEPWERSGSWAFHMALCLLGPLFFLSYAFSLLALLPSLYLLIGIPDRRLGRFWWAISVVLGTVLCSAIHGWMGAAGFLALVGLPSLALGELLLQKRGPEIAISGAVLAALAGAFAIFCFYCQKKGLGLSAGFQELVNLAELYVKDMSGQALDLSRSSWSEETVNAVEEIKANPRLALRELPGLFLAGILLLSALPTLVLLRWNPRGLLRRAEISRDFLRKWRSPEWLVWPSILCVALLLFEAEPFTEIARNCLKPLLLIYFFQGMSILAYFLDSLRLRGLFRVPIYAIGMLMYPMVVSFGFFDLWLNFRNRHSSGEREEEKKS